MQCPDCGKRFAAKLPKVVAPSAYDQWDDVGTQTWDVPVRKPRYAAKKKADEESIQKLVVAALVLVCVGSVLIPLGFGGYYLFSKLSQSSSAVAMNDGATSGAQSGPENTAPAILEEPASNVHVLAPNPYDLDLAVTDPGRQVPRAQIVPPDAVPKNLTADPNSSASNSPGIRKGLVGAEDLGASDPNNFASNPGQSPATPSIPGSQPPSSGSPAPATSGSQGDTPFGLSAHMRKYSGKDGAFIFVMDQQNSLIGQAVTELTSALSIKDRSIEIQNDHTIIGLRYSGALQEISKHFKFGRVSYVDEDARTIHVQPN